MRLLALRLNKHNLIFSGSPLPALALAKAAVGKSTLRNSAGRRSLRSSSSPIPQTTHTHTYTHTDYKLLHIQTHPQNPRSPRLRRFEPPA